VRDRFFQCRNTPVQLAGTPVKEFLHLLFGHIRTPVQPCKDCLPETYPVGYAQVNAGEIWRLG
jgi:hypothetical protein